MAGGANKSGVSSWIGAQLYFLNGVREMWIVVLVSLMTSLLTEVISNTSTATILMPVLNELVSYNFVKCKQVNKLRFCVTALKPSDSCFVVSIRYLECKYEFLSNRSL